MSEMNGQLIEKLMSVQKTIKPGDRTIFYFQNVIDCLKCPDHGHAQKMIGGNTSNNGVKKGIDLLIQHDPNFREYIANFIFDSS